MNESAGGWRARATEAAHDRGRVVPTPGWSPGAGEEVLVQHAPIAVSPPERRASDPPIGLRRRLLLLVAWPLDRTGLGGWRLVGTVAVVIGVLWLAAVLVGLYPEGSP